MSSFLIKGLYAAWLGVVVHVPTPVSISDPGREGSSQEVVACELVDLASAESVLGSGTKDFGEGAAGSCRYDDSESRLVMVVQVFDVVMYDAVPVNPATPIDLGDRGRYGVGTSGTAHVQFAKGRFSVTIRVTPMMGPPATDLLDPLLDVARLAAERIPS